MNRGLLTLFGLLLGGAAGLWVGAGPPATAGFVVGICRPLGMLWLSALRMTVLPLVVSVLVTGVMEVADVAHTGRLARRALAWIAGLSAAAAILAALLARAAFSLLPRPTGPAKSRKHSAI